MADELDTAGAVAAYLGTRNQEQAVRSTVTLALGVNPDEEAEYRRLAKAAGIPVDSVRENKAAVQQQVNAPDFTDLAERFPSTSKYLANIDNARLAHDDIDSLKEIEQSFRQAQIQGRAVRGKVDEPFSRPGDQRTSSGRVGETFVRRGELAADDGSYVGGLLDTNRFRVPFAGARISIADQLGMDPTGAIRDFERLSSRAEAAKPQIDSVTGRAIYGGLDSLVTMAPGLAASILLANPAPVLAWAGATTGGSAYGKYRARGGTPGQAAVGAVGEGAVEVATELLPMGFLVSRFGKAGAGEFITGLLAREVPSEQVATFVQDAIDTAVANPDKTWEEFVRERPQAAYETLVSTVVQSGAMAGVSAVVRNTVMREQASQYEATRAEEAAALAEKLAKVAEASKLKERDPEAFKEFIAQVAESGDGPAEFYVDAQQLANSLNQSAVTLQELRAVAPSVAAQLEAGFVPGADIRVPVTEFAAAPADITTALIDHLREAPDAMSRAEAQEFLKKEGERIKQDVQTVLADHTNRVARQQAADTARQVFEEQLAAAGRFRPEVNRAYATVLGNFYATQAERVGMTVEEFLDRYQLRTGKVQPGPLGSRQTLEQADTQTGRGSPIRIEEGENQLAQFFDGVTDFRVTRTDDSVYIDNFEVEYDRRGEGLGKSAVRKALRALAEAGVVRVDLDARLDAAEFWERMGFKWQGEEEESVYMFKELKPIPPNADTTAGNPNDQNILHQDAQGLSPEEAAQVVAILENAGLGNLEMVETIADLPESGRRKIQSEGAQGTRGMYDPATDTTYLVRQNIASLDEAFFVALHEAFHRGLRKTVGQNVAPLLQSVHDGNERVRTLAARYMESQQIDLLEAVEEVLADMAGQGEVGNLKGWDALVAFLKDAITKMARAAGVKVEITDDMVTDIVAGMRRAGMQDSPAKQRTVVEMRKREKVLQSLLECLGAA